MSYRIFCRTRAQYFGGPGLDRVDNRVEPYGFRRSFQDAHAGLMRLAQLEVSPDSLKRSETLTYTKTTSWAIGLTAAEAYRIYTQDGNIFGVVTRVWYIQGPDGQVGATTGFIKQLDRVPSRSTHGQ